MREEEETFGAYGLSPPLLFRLMEGWLLNEVKLRQNNASRLCDSQYNVIF